MKTKMQKLSVTAMALIIAVLMSSHAMGQRRMANCINTIPDLTEKQENKIENLRAEHFREIDSLRNNRRAALNWEKKEQTGIQINKARIEHRKEIRSVLNEEQQEHFDQYLNSARFGKRGRGRGRGRGHGRGRNRGGGYRMGNCPWR